MSTAIRDGEMAHRHAAEPGGNNPPVSRWLMVRHLVFLVLATCLIFAHGCHPEDVDDELFAWWQGEASAQVAE
jgi:hypothetical protein